MRAVFLLFISLILASAPVFAGGFDFQMKSPNINISIPAFPAVQMKPHPMKGQQPHLRYAGELEPYVITIMTPTADAGMTPMECANSTAGSYVSRYSLTDSQYAIYRMNESTVLFEYLTNTGGEERIHAHLFSGYKGSHGVDVHISRAYTSDKDIDAMHGSFGGSSIISEF